MRKLRAKWASMGEASRWRLLILAAMLIGAVVSTGIGLAMNHDVAGTFLNFGSEMGGAFVTFILLDMILASRDEQEAQQRREEDLRRRLIGKLGSAINTEARRAAEELRVLGWLSDGTLSEIELVNANLEGVDLRGANLRGAKLHRANLHGAKLSDADLSGAFLIAADLRDASCVRLKVEDAHLAGADLTGCKQLGRQTLACAARLKGTIMPDGSRYNGCFCLDGDLYQFEKYTSTRKLDDTDPAIIAEWYGIETEAYVKGQQWAQAYLTRARAGELDENTRYITDSLTVGK